MSDGFVKDTPERRLAREELLKRNLVELLDQTMDICAKQTKRSNNVLVKGNKSSKKQMARIPQSFN